MSSGTRAANAFSGVTSKSVAPATLPATQTTIKPRRDRSHRGRRSRSASPATRFPGVKATVFEAFATIGGSPAASSAGNVIRDAPPTIAVTTPPVIPAPKSISPD